jgi:hypothetical protein
MLEALRAERGDQPLALDAGLEDEDDLLPAA